MDSRTRELLTDFVNESRNHLGEITEHLDKRGLNKNILEKFQLGYLPNTQTLFNCLKKKWSATEAIEIAVSLKLLSKIKGDDLKYTSLFSGRLIFPIFDVYGRVIGVSGRSLDENRKPKYFNTVFPKGKHLYGFNFAIEQTLDENNLFLVEGYMDVIAAHKIGVTNIGGVMGTAIKEDLITLICRYTNHISLMLDQDPAGKSATEKTLKKKRSSLIVDINPLCLPKGYKDLDEFVLKKESEAKIFLKNKKNNLK